MTELNLDITNIDPLYCHLRSIRIEDYNYLFEIDLLGKDVGSGEWYFWSTKVGPAEIWPSQEDAPDVLQTAESTYGRVIRAQSECVSSDSASDVLNQIFGEVGLEFVPEADVL